MNAKSLIGLVLILFSFFFGTIGDGFAQKNSSIQDSSWTSKGFDFYFSAGAYFANKYNAEYYNGSRVNENNIFYVLGNKYKYDEVFNFMREKYPYITDSIFLVSLPVGEMRYSTAFAFSIGLKYKFNKHWGLNVNYSYSQLKAMGSFILDYHGPQSNTQVDRPFQEWLIGTEQRSFIEASVSYLFHPHNIIKPFLEIGAQFNYVNVRHFIMVLEDQKEYTLLDPYNGADYVPGVDLQEYPTKWGGSGYGFFMTAGIKIAFNKYVSIDPTFYLSGSSFHLPGYRNFNLNYGASVRLVINDMLFYKMFKK
ncbi:MAG: hypothetical protein LBU51_02675 [Bacteroidales bacterium]|jgi:hypothetical protein|nr:hypothetical protein [Bacteroidales bacterium]